MLTFRYNRGLSPPAPYLDLEIAPFGRRRKPIRRRAKLDSGASMTVIPYSLLNQWQIPFVETVEVRAYNGQVSRRPVYVVNIVIGSRHFQEVRVTVAPRRDILLGRDVMNRLRILLDGPDLVTEIHGA
jgi:predicted aspartyl protease